MKTLKHKSELSEFINKVKYAKKFATEAHYGVKRRGGQPYISHPDAVAKILHSVKKSKEIASLVVASYLHDTVEDTNVTIDDIKNNFGLLVASLVCELTSDEDKLKISGKEEYLIDKMLNMTSWALCIKLADRLHNTYDFDNIMSSGSEKAKIWVIKYANQTKNIIEEVEWYRDLTPTHKVLVERIKEKIKKYC